VTDFIGPDRPSGQVAGSTIDSLSQSITGRLELPKLTRWLVVTPVEVTPDRLLVSALTVVRAASTAHVLVDLVVFALRNHESACGRIASILQQRGISVQVHLVPHSDKRSWFERLEPALAVAESETAKCLIDVSCCAVGTAVQLSAASLAEESAVLCWLDPVSQTIVDAVGTVHAAAIDIGEAPSSVEASEFLSVFGFEERPADPYGVGVGQSANLEAVAVSILVSLWGAPETDGPYTRLRRLLRPGQSGDRDLSQRRIAAKDFPRELLDVVDRLERVGFVSKEMDTIVVRGPDDQCGVFLLSGGWLEIVAGMALRAAFPRHQVKVNLSLHWGPGDHTHAETDLSFVHRNRIHIVSCKNDFVGERLFQHFDRFRAVVAEFGESRVRALLFSTGRLTRQQELRCQSYEIEHRSGQRLLDLLHETVVRRKPDEFRRSVQASANRAPRPGMH